MEVEEHVVRNVSVKIDLGHEFQKYIMAVTYH